MQPSAETMATACNPSMSSESSPNRNEETGNINATAESLTGPSSSSSSSSGDNESSSDDGISVKHQSSAASSEEKTGPIVRFSGGHHQNPGLFLRGYEKDNDVRRGKRKRGHATKREKESAAFRRQNRDYSDSDNSYQALEMSNRNKLAELVDLEDVATGTLCSQLLFAGLDSNEISELIGFATHHSVEEQSVNLEQTRPPDRNGSNVLEDYGLAPSIPQHPLWRSQQAQWENPLLGLPNVPLPPSHLHYLSQTTLSIPEFEKKLEEGFADSALVAIGMLIEEMITASLLPLAGFHVLRCREIEKLSTDVSDAMDQTQPSPDKSDIRQLSHPTMPQKIWSDQISVNRNDIVCDEWTLPPEEAMLKLLEQNAIPNDGLELTSPPTRSMIAPANNYRRPPTNEWQSIQKWSKAQGLDPYYVVQNMDVYRLFLKMTNLPNRWKG